MNIAQDEAHPQRTLPQRTLAYKGMATDTARWDSFTHRDDDISICTPEKCGTTWLQTMIAMMILRTTEVNPPPTVISPWLDAGLMPLEMMLPMLEDQQHRRFMKTHTPLDGIPYFESCTYLTVHRDPRDVHFSMRNHALNMHNDGLAGQFPEDINEGFLNWVNLPHVDGAQEVFSLEALTHHYLTYKKFEHLPNMHMFHYADMLRDPKAAMAQVAGILNLDVEDSLMDQLVEASSFKQMKENAGKFVPGAGMGLWLDEGKFFNKGASKQWEGVISDENLAAYDARMAKLLSPEDVAWYQGGANG
jgi:aryl sulfotransferase